jgi:hypothetical protein
MKIKVGKYEIDEWVVSKVLKDTPNNLRVCDDGISIFGIILYFENNKWLLSIYDDLLLKSYNSMFPNKGLEFETLEDGKARVDLFLDKLQKLKAFL